MQDPTPFISDSSDWRRFWVKVDKREPDECWRWIASITTHGYGQFSCSDGTVRRPVGAHRLAYAMLVAPIPKGMFIDHLCRNRWCVNPTHMEVVTNKENIVRGMWGDESRRQSAKTECPQGHPYEGDNIYVIKSRPTARYCRTCNNSKHRRVSA